MKLNNMNLPELQGYKNFHNLRSDLITSAQLLKNNYFQ